MLDESELKFFLYKQINSGGLIVIDDEFNGHKASGEIIKVKNEVNDRSPIIINARYLDFLAAVQRKLARKQNSRTEK